MRRSPPASLQLESMGAKKRRFECITPDMPPQIKITETTPEVRETPKTETGLCKSDNPPDGSKH